VVYAFAFGRDGGDPCDSDSQQESTSPPPTSAASRRV
jgi:hypothetical protein